MAYTIEDLKYLMARLRHPEKGCPWDLKQTYRSIVPHTLEEAHEVADTIEREDFAHLRDELGDLLFQVIFYSQLATEEERFGFDEVVDGAVRKLLRRHPHVFPDGTLESEVPEGTRPEELEIKANWERIKAEERAEKGEQSPDAVSVMDDVAATLPSLARAEKLQRRASTVGFDWPELEPVLDKLHEEIEELQEAAETPQAERRQDRVEDELGDLLFVCVNLARFLKVNPDQALRRANRKFEDRFRLMEQALQEKGESFAGRSLDGLEELWQAAKRSQKRG
ncbi:nucleoside triphosphate pyrophosphohydrolase [Marinobacteraceae bacterium S3BR75-40.1]